MQKNNVILLVGVIITLTVIAVLGIKGCADRGKVVTVSPIQPQIDSMDKWKREASIVIDSLVREIKHQTKATDSLKAKTQKQDNELEVNNVKIRALVREAELYRKYADTLAYLHACDTLLPRIEEMAQKEEMYRRDKISLGHSYDSLLSTNSLLIARMQFNQGVLQERFDKLAEDALELERQNKKLTKVNNRKFAFGVQIGYGATRDGFSPYLGAGVTLKIFQF